MSAKLYDLDSESHIYKAIGFWQPVHRKYLIIVKRKLTTKKKLNVALIFGINKNI